MRLEPADLRHLIIRPCLAAALVVATAGLIGLSYLP